MPQGFVGCGLGPPFCALRGQLPTAHSSPCCRSTSWSVLSLRFTDQFNGRRASIWWEITHSISLSENKQDRPRVQTKDVVGAKGDLLGHSWPKLDGTMQPILDESFP